MTLDEIRQKKKQYGYTNEQMAKLSGLPLSTVQKVLGGTTKAPRRQTLAALAAVFPKETPVSYREDVTALPSGIAEPPAAYGARRTPRWPRQGEYTLEDYLALPDDVRVELIDGVFYDMGAPTTVHQEVVGEVFFLLKSFIRSHGGSCRPFISPVDVQLDADDRTIVQPDVLILCDPSKRTYERIVGAPDLVIEVLSPSTRSKDILIKTKKYALAGVREYWIVDPQQERVTTYLFSPVPVPGPEADAAVPDGPEIAIYGYSFEETVPVAVLGGECTICFREIAEQYGLKNVAR